MSNFLASFMELGGHLVQQPLHGISPVQHSSGFFIALHEMLDFSLKLLVYFLVFENADQAAVDLPI